MEAYQVKMEMENLVCEMAEDFRKIYMYQPTNVSATNVCVSESYLTFLNLALLLWRSANNDSTELFWQQPDAGG